MDSLSTLAETGHIQFSCNGFHRSQLTHPWRCPPHGLITSQGRRMCRQHRRSNRLSKRVGGLPIAQIQQQEPNHLTRRSCGSCKRNIACNVDPLTCNSCHDPFHRFSSDMTRDAAAATLARNSWICRHCTTTPPQLRQGPMQVNRFECRRAFAHSSQLQAPATAGENVYLPNLGNNVYL